MTACRAALNIAGEGYNCELEAPHPGWDHSNKEAQAIWCSNREARRHDKQEKPRC